MNHKPSLDRRWAPLGKALLAYHHGEKTAEFTVHSDLWADEITAVEEFYRPEHSDLPELEVRALNLCEGRVLDVGAGAGRHALELQRRGLPVTTLDVLPDAVQVMKERGIRDARCGDLSAVEDEKFDTLLLLMHGIGVVGSLHGLAGFLEEAVDLLNQGGQIICDSADLATVMPALLDETPGAANGEVPYYGEVEFRLSFGGSEGEPYPWLFVDFPTLARFGRKAGFDCTNVARGARAAYLAHLVRR